MRNRAQRVSRDNGTHPQNGLAGVQDTEEKAHIIPDMAGDQKVLAHMLAAVAGQLGRLQRVVEDVPDGYREVAAYAD